MTDTTAGEGVVVPRDLLRRLIPECELGCHPICWTAPDHKDRSDCCFARRALAAQPSAGARGEASRKTVKTGQEVWVRATAGDVCTSCVYVKIDTIHDKPVGSYLHWKDVSLATPAQPDTGDVAALREALEVIQYADDAAGMRVLARQVLAALSKPNAQGREG